VMAEPFVVDPSRSGSGHLILPSLALLLAGPGWRMQSAVLLAVPLCAIGSDVVSVPS